MATALSSTQLLVSLGARQVLANSAAACAAEMGSMRSTLHVLAAHLEALQGSPVQLPIAGELQVPGGLLKGAITCAHTCHKRAHTCTLPSRERLPVQRPLPVCGVMKDHQLSVSVSSAKHLQQALTTQHCDVLSLGSSNSPCPDGCVCCAAEAVADLQSPGSPAQGPLPQPLLLPPPPAPKAVSAETQADTLSESCGQEVGTAASVHGWYTEARPWTCW